MMAIVLPRRKKRADIFAPSKAIQDAKSKIGPAFFDVTLMECSRNAVELTKLVNQWEDLDKEKVKILKDITHEQEVLLRTLKKNKVDEFGEINSDASPNAPGFRFKCNGEIKKSTTSLPVEHFSDYDNDEMDEVEHKHILSGNSSSTNALHRPKSALHKRKNEYERVDFENEISKLENVLKDIYNDLFRNKISMPGLSGNSSNASSGKVKTFLRAHTNEYVPMPECHTNDVGVFEKPNDRFAFQPGCSSKRDTYLHKHSIKTPSHRSCIGCQIRLRSDNDDITKMKMSQSETMGKRRWNYVPQGKYVQSTTTLHATKSLADRRSSVNLSNKTSNTKMLTKSAKSMVHFNTKKTEVPLRGAMSMATPKLTRRPQSCVTFMTNDRPGSKTETRPTSQLSTIASKSGCGPELAVSRSINVLGYKSGIDLDSDKTSQGRRSSISLRSARASSDRIHAHFVDHESRLNVLKALEVEEGKNCQKKVNEFLNKIGSKK